MKKKKIPFTLFACYEDVAKKPPSSPSRPWESSPPFTSGCLGVWAGTVVPGEEAAGMPGVAGRPRHCLLHNTHALPSAEPGALRALLLSLCSQLVYLISGCPLCLLLAAPRRDQNLIISGDSALEKGQWSVAAGSTELGRRQRRQPPPSGVFGWIPWGDRASLGLGWVWVLPAAAPSAAGELCRVPSPSRAEIRADTAVPSCAAPAGLQQLSCCNSQSQLVSTLLTCTRCCRNGCPGELGNQSTVLWLAGCSIQCHGSLFSAAVLGLFPLCGLMLVQHQYRGVRWWGGGSGPLGHSRPLTKELDVVMASISLSSQHTNSFQVKQHV